MYCISSKQKNSAKCLKVLKMGIFFSTKECFPSQKQGYFSCLHWEFTTDFSGNRIEFNSLLCWKILETLMWWSNCKLIFIICWEDRCYCSCPKDAVHLAPSLCYVFVSCVYLYLWLAMQAVWTEGRAQGCSPLLQNNTFPQRHQVPPPALLLFCICSANFYIINKREIKPRSKLCPLNPSVQLG